MWRFLINCSQVRNQHVWNAHWFRPWAIYFHNRKVLGLWAHIWMHMCLVSEQIGHVFGDVKLDGLCLIEQVAWGSEPVYLFVCVHHHHGMRIPSCYLVHLLYILLVDEQSSRRQLTVKVAMAELSFVARAPCVYFTQAWLCDCVFVAAFNCVNLFADVSEALDKLRVFSRICMPKPKLSVWVVLSKSVHQTL